MNRHIVDDALLDEVLLAIGRGETWFAYNTVPSFLEKGDVYSLKIKLLLSNLL